MGVKISTWAEFKSVVVSRNLPIEETRTANGYHLESNHGGIKYIVDLTKNSADYLDYESNFKDSVAITPTATSGTISTPKLRFDNLTQNQSLSNGSYTTIYSCSTGTGLLYGAFLKFTEKNVDVRVTADGEQILELKLEELPKSDEGSGPTWVKRLGDKELELVLPSPLRYLSSILIEAQAHKSGKKLSYGYTVLTQES